MARLLFKILYMRAPPLPVSEPGRGSHGGARNQS